MIYLNNQKGFGMLSALIVAGLIAFMAFSVSIFIGQTSELNIRLETQGEMVSVANSVSQVIKSSDNALSIYSYGPNRGTNTLPQDVYVDQLGATVRRFSDIGGGVLSAIEAPDGNFLFTGIHNDKTSLPTDMQSVVFHNYRNINTAFNNLLAIVTTHGGTCCSDDPMEMRNSNLSKNTSCGGGSGDLINDIPEVQNILDNSGIANLEARLATKITQNGVDLCSSGSLSSFPTGANNLHAEYIVEVFRQDPLDPNSGRVSYAKNAVSLPSDNSPPIALLEFDGLSCFNGIPYEYYDGTSPTLEANVVTVADTQSCRNCLASLPNTGGCPGYKPITSCVNTNQCIPSDPGSQFFCRVGEMGHGTGTAQSRFFEGSASEEWEPCQLANIYYRDVATKTTHTIGDIEIEYLFERDSTLNTDSDISNLLPAQYQSESTQRWTQARLYMTFDTTVNPSYFLNRKFQADIRAVDSSGKNISRSMCNEASYCDQPGFVLTNGYVNILNWNCNNSGPAVMPQSVPGATNPFTMDFQCDPNTTNNTCTFQIDNSDDGIDSPYDLGINTCTATATYPDASTAALSCNCSTTGGCTVITPTANDGEYILSLEVSTPPVPPEITLQDGYGSSTKDESWCRDTLDQFDTAMQDVTPDDYPTFGVNTTLTAEKKCPLAQAWPDIDGTKVTYTTSSSINTETDASSATPILEWNVLTDSGCLEKKYDYQLCIQSYDGCGRPATVTTGSSKGYASLLTDLAGATWECGEANCPWPTPDQQANGNACESDKFCQPTGGSGNGPYKCVAGDSCSKKGESCTAHSECQTDDLCVDAVAAQLCGGASYWCNSTSGKKTADDGDCSADGDTCTNSGYTCEGETKACVTYTEYKNDTGTTETAGSPCTLHSNCSGETNSRKYCGWINTGICQNDGVTACATNEQCTEPGTCSLKSAGSCQCPTNQKCTDTNTVGDVKHYCPRLDTCLNSGPIVDDPICTSSCQCVEVSRGSCQATSCTGDSDQCTGQVTIQTECRDLDGNACGTCGGCAPIVEACTGATEDTSGNACPITPYTLPPLNCCPPGETVVNGVCTDQAGFIFSTTDGGAETHDFYWNGNIHGRCEGCNDNTYACLELLSTVSASHPLNSNPGSGTPCVSGTTPNFSVWITMGSNPDWADLGGGLYKLSVNKDLDNQTGASWNWVPGTYRLFWYTDKDNTSEPYDTYDLSIDCPAGEVWSDSNYTCVPALTFTSNTPEYTNGDHLIQSIGNAEATAEGCTVLLFSSHPAADAFKNPYGCVDSGGNTTAAWIPLGSDQWTGSAPNYSLDIDLLNAAENWWVVPGSYKTYLRQDPSAAYQEFTWTVKCSGTFDLGPPFKCN